MTPEVKRETWTRFFPTAFVTAWPYRHFEFIFITYKERIYKVREYIFITSLDCVTLLQQQKLIQILVPGSMVLF